MASAWRSGLVRDIRTLFEAGAVAVQPDGELLDRFHARGTEAAERAFAALVDRHGPMVLNVCRGVLDNAHDAEDAFQATFLILVEKASSIRRRESVGSWLHGVALRVSSCARASSARRRRYEKQRAESAEWLTTSSDQPDDLGAVVHEEVERLPEKYRAPVVLCDLEGHSYDEAARQLVCPVGTVKSRLARGREKLRARLVRRGLAPSVLAMMTALVPDASAAVSASLQARTVAAALSYATGHSAVPGAISASVAALTRGVLHAMFLTKLKSSAVALLAIAVLATGAIGQPTAEGTPRDDREADRLRGLERKLDNVLEMLQRQQRDRPAPGPLPAPPAPPRAGGLGGAGRGYARDAVRPRAELDADEKAAQAMSSMMMGSAPRFVERIERIEIRLEAVEKRLGELDHRLHVLEERRNSPRSQAGNAAPDLDAIVADQVQRQVRSVERRLSEPELPSAPAGTALPPPRAQ